jgi:regulator of protease activity HflC (stomatin/prohibitin superfamily)
MSEENEEVVEVEEIAVAGESETVEPQWLSAVMARLDALEEIKAAGEVAVEIIEAEAKAEAKVIEAEAEADVARIEAATESAIEADGKEVATIADAADGTRSPNTRSKWGRKFFGDSDD